MLQEFKAFHHHTNLISFALHLTSILNTDKQMDVTVFFRQWTLMNWDMRTQTNQFQHCDACAVAWMHSGYCAKWTNLLLNCQLEGTEEGDTWLASSRSEQFSGLFCLYLTPSLKLLELHLSLAKTLCKRPRLLILILVVIGHDHFSITHKRGYPVLQKTGQVRNCMRMPLHWI